MDFRQFYDLESYFERTVRPLFEQHGYLTAFDFFCIVIWKSNRAKSKIARKLLLHGYKDLNTSVKVLTRGLTQKESPKEKLQYLFKDWEFGLPMATAILTLLYPNEFTIYDYRVCDALGRFHKLNNKLNFENLWRGYLEFKEAVETAVPNELSLRDKDRYLWGKSFFEQLKSDIENGFIKS